MEKSKNNTLFIILLSVVGLFLVAGIALAFVLNYNVFKPEQVNILDDGNNVYVSTTVNNNYLFYRFKFVDEENEEIIIDCSSNVVDINKLVSEGIEIGKEYKVSTCYISENEGNNSNFSDEIVWVPYMYLKVPILSYQSEEDMLVWDEVENADSYVVYYNNRDALTSINCDKNNLKLDKIEGGLRNFYVVAKSDNENFKTSAISNQIQLTIIHHLKQFTSISFDNINNILRVENEEEIQRLAVYLNDEPIEIIDYNCAFDEEEKVYKYEIDLTNIYLNQAIGISPITINQYNVFEGEVLFLTSEEPEGNV